MNSPHRLYKNKGEMILIEEDEEKGEESNMDEAES